MVRTAWVNKKSELKKDNPDITARKFSYRMKNRMYYQEFGKEHQKAGFFPTVLGYLIPIIPKVGPLSKLRFKAPGNETEIRFIKSFEASLSHYESAVNASQYAPVLLPNRTLDTGKETAIGTYSIADENYKEFLLKLRKKGYKDLSPDIKKDLIAFYAHAKPPVDGKKRLKEWNEISHALDELNKSLLTVQTVK
jgi:hypothetical protein